MSVSRYNETWAGTREVGPGGGGSGVASNRQLMRVPRTVPNGGEKNDIPVPKSPCAERRGEYR